MKTVALDVRSPKGAMADFTRVWKIGKGDKPARITFATPELLWKVLTAKRWQLLKAMWEPALHRFVKQRAAWGGM